jgi:hypothetical protein
MLGMRSQSFASVNTFGKSKSDIIGSVIGGGLGLGTICFCAYAAYDKAKHCALSLRASFPPQLAV